ncbi:hypothetical protein OG590_40450 (plasmid) [Streptomyces goshikiensis]|uniref:hypothetical protein n=1 Tax=Streptomyces TaxID=1883 RepID=UPI000C27A95C|nr:hypothetical protein [Streptomyces sp. CB02120-2]PJN14508.1 hypothetical protein CG724_32955 [Streptomyces sp. CB02120-2]WSY03469.1 hypothetical protein OG590_40450 [Streptomyces goshikiensis]
MSDTLFRTLGLIEPGDLVLYHGSIPEHHGLYLARPCDCFYCGRADHLGSDDTRYRLTDPFAEDPDACTVHHVRRKSITRSTANA